MENGACTVVYIISKLSELNDEAQKTHATMAFSLLILRQLFWSTVLLVDY